MTVVQSTKNILLRIAFVLDDEGGHLFILVIMLGVKLKHDLAAIAGEINLLIKLYMSYHF